MHNSAICNSRKISKTKQETKTGTTSSTNDASNISLPEELREEFEDFGRKLLLFLSKLDRVPITLKWASNFGVLDWGLSTPLICLQLKSVYKYCSQQLWPF